MRGAPLSCTASVAEQRLRAMLRPRCVFHDACHFLQWVQSRPLWVFAVWAPAVGRARALLAGPRRENLRVSWRRGVVCGCSCTAQFTSVVGWCLVYFTASYKPHSISLSLVVSLSPTPSHPSSVIARRAARTVTCSTAPYFTCVDSSDAVNAGAPPPPGNALRERGRDREAGGRAPPP